MEAYSLTRDLILLARPSAAIWHSSVAYSVWPAATHSLAWGCLSVPFVAYCMWSADPGYTECGILEAIATCAHPSSSLFFLSHSFEGRFAVYPPIPLRNLQTRLVVIIDQVSRYLEQHPSKLTTRPLIFRKYTFLGRFIGPASLNMSASGLRNRYVLLALWHAMKNVADFR